jgi:hypothetical protein
MRGDERERSLWDVASLVSVNSLLSNMRTGHVIYFVDLWYSLRLDRHPNGSCARWKKCGLPPHTTEVVRSDGNGGTCRL